MKTSPAVDWRGYYDREGESKTFHPESDPAERMRVDFVGRLTAGTSFASALDVGCGNGYLASLLGERGASRVAGVDFSRPRLQDGHQRYSHIRFARASAVALPFSDNSFDLITMVEVMEHLPDPAAALAELRRVSRRWVAVTVPYRGKLLEITCPHCLKDFHFDGHIHSFDESSIAALAEGAGLRVKAVETYTPFYPSRRGALKHLSPTWQQRMRGSAVRLGLVPRLRPKYLGILAEV